jgi:cysteine synthase
LEETTQRLVASLGAFRADQFVRGGNRKAHYHGTAPEIWSASGGTVTAFCDFVGTGGSFGGCASYFRPRGVRCYVVEPKGAAILSGRAAAVTQPNHRIQGGGYLRRKDDLPMLSPTMMEGSDCCVDGAQPDSSSSLIDGYLEVAEEEAIRAARDLAKFEGIFAGFSAGANLAAAIELLRTRERGGTVAILICDSGLKYLSTDLWEDAVP